MLKIRQNITFLNQIREKRHYRVFSLDSYNASPCILPLISVLSSKLSPKSRLLTNEKAENNRLPWNKIFHCVRYNEIIEKQPNNQPYPPDLTYRENIARQPIHKIRGYDQNSSTAILVPVDSSQPQHWINWYIRK
ncbi:MAG: hypothetical protein HEQ29_13340 [Dolichospermum sp. LBC05a]|nr:MAG: hypothetical protein HEQ29_13340 [Dolichospermum sp. LBC05a]